jgi:hypothetical protein
VRAHSIRTSMSSVDVIDRFAHFGAHRPPLPTPTPHIITLSAARHTNAHTNTYTHRNIHAFTHPSLPASLVQLVCLAIRVVQLQF